MGEYAPPVDPNEGLVEFNGWLGLRNNVDVWSLSENDLTVALNIDLDDSLTASRRKGCSAPVTSAIDRDLWASGPMCLGVGTNALKRVLPDYSTVTLRTGLVPGRPLAYAEVGARVMWSNGVDQGIVQDGANRTWGITPPATPPAVAI